MKKDIKALIRNKQLTGELVGQAMVMDLLRLYGGLRGEDLPPPLTEHEKQQMVAALESPEEIRAYTDYRLVIAYLQQVGIHHTCAWQEAEIHFLKFFTALSSVDVCENLIAQLETVPPLMDDQRATHLKVEAAARFERGYVESGWCLAALPLALDEQDALYGLTRVFSPAPDAETFDGVKRVLNAWQASHAEAFEAMGKRLHGLQGFSAANWSRLVPCAQLKSAFPALYHQLYELRGENPLPLGYAIPREGARSTDPHHWSTVGLRPTMARLGGQMVKIHRRFLHSARHTLAIEALLSLVAQRAGVPQITNLIAPAPAAGRLEQIGGLVAQMATWPRFMGEAEREALAEEYARLFPDVPAENLAPLPAAMARTRAVLEDLNAIEHFTQLHALLLEGSEPVDGP